jgi:hypothetical protein
MPKLIERLCRSYCSSAPMGLISADQLRAKLAAQTR